LHLDDTSTQERKFGISNLWVFSICFKNLIRTPLNFDFGLLRNEINQWIWSLIKALMKVISKIVTWGVTEGQLQEEGMRLHWVVPHDQGRIFRSYSDSDSDSDVSDDLTYDGLSSNVHKLEDALCCQDKLLCFVFLWEQRCTMIWKLNHVKIAIWSWWTMLICGLCTLKLQVNWRVRSWNSNSSKLIPYYLVLVWNVPNLNLSWTLIPSRLKNLRQNCNALIFTRN
jgi:hypothetical protein